MLIEMLKMALSNFAYGSYESDSDFELIPAESPAQLKFKFDPKTLVYSDGFQSIESKLKNFKTNLLVIDEIQAAYDSKPNSQDSSKMLTQSQRASPFGLGPWRVSTFPLLPSKALRRDTSHCTQITLTNQEFSLNELFHCSTQLIVMHYSQDKFQRSIERHLKDFETLVGGLYLFKAINKGTEKLNPQTENDKNQSAEITTQLLESIQEQVTKDLKDVIEANLLIPKLQTFNASYGKIR